VLFQSYDYLLFFLPIVFVGYLALRRTTLCNVLLLAASYFFYCYESYYLIFYILFSSTLDYVLGPRIDRAESPRARKLLLACSLTGNLGLLFILKYFSWLFDVVSPHLVGVLPGTVVDWKPPVFTLPPGISFYTFQTLTYTIDIYRKRLRPTHSLIDFYTYVAFFPQLVAGPIERCRDLLPQLARKRPRPDPADLEQGFFLIAWGLFKKLVLADNLGNIVDLVYLQPDSVPGAVLILPYAFCFQIYCDFSAYTDIARGSAALFGIRLSRNFLTPYFSGGERRGRGRTLANLLVTMFLGGLWHGAGLFFILWGLYHGALLVLYRFLPLDEILPRWAGRTGRVLAVGIMFFFTCFGWLLFRSDAGVFVPLLGTLRPLLEHPLDPHFWHFVYGTTLFVVPVVITDWIGYKRGAEFVDVYLGLSVRAKVALYVGIFFATSLLAKREGYGFIYFQF
jgi:D-alanyl-lipoteichoic acid acyltransferase DltB (MBOAT superfamily)